MTPPLFNCPFPGCSLSYRRKEHLTRHAKSHSQPQFFKCPFCDRSFSRNDTLRHHVRSHHQDKELKPARATQACTYCRARRSRCDGQNPCDRCSRLGKKCSYPRRSVSQRDSLDEDRELAYSRTRTSSILRSEGLEVSPCRVRPYVQAYFDMFHPKWPFLHLATFEYMKEPAFLFQSVVMMGMWVNRESYAQERAKDLNHRLISCIYEQRDHWAISEDYEAISNPTPWPLATYQGILLQIIFSLLLHQDPVDLGLTPVLPEIPSELLKALVRSCRKRDMLFYPSMHSQFEQGENPEVFIWVSIEEVKRFALSLYRVCQRARLHDSRDLENGRDHTDRSTSRLEGANLLSLVDLRFALPDSDELWHLTSGLADRLAVRLEAYREANSENNWISQTARLLQPQGEQFRWI